MGWEGRGGIERSINSGDRLSVYLHVMAFILSMYVLTSNNVFTKNQILQLICDLNEQVSAFLALSEAADLIGKSIIQMIMKGTNLLHLIN